LQQIVTDEIQYPVFVLVADVLMLKQIISETKKKKTLARVKQIHERKGYFASAGWVDG